MKNIFIKVGIVSFFMLFLQSCSLLAFLGNMMCDYAPDSDHCHQFAAVQNADPDECEKIKGTKFKDTGSNPPRDKCYLTIAENTGDYSVCKNIKGGPMSYTKEECVDGAAQKLLTKSIEDNDINGCIKLGKIPGGSKKAYDQCTQTLATSEKLNGSDKKMDDIIEALKKNPDDSDLRKQLADMKKLKQTTYEMMNSSERVNYFKGKREEIMGDIEDEDVKSAISKEYTAYKGNETNINNMLDKLEQITTKQQTIKRLDEEANELVDQVKEQLEGIVKDKQDQVVGEMGENAQKWIEENGGARVKSALENYKWTMEKYEKGSKMYEDAKGKYDKIKGVYDEVMGVYNRVDQVNKMLAEGKIDAGKAKVLKGAVLLDKGLEYATGYVPVFGSTISKVSKETFGTVIELAKKRAERSTALDKCFDDPANCDTSKISAY